MPMEGPRRDNVGGRPLSTSLQTKSPPSSQTGPGPGMRGFSMSPGKPGRGRTSSPPSTKIRSGPMRGEFDPYRDNSGGHDDKDYRVPPTMATPTQPKQRFDQTTVLINDRFLMITGPLPPLSPNENITIGIERNIPGNEPAIIRREIYPDQVILIRRKDEGSSSACITHRPEFREPKPQYVEKRTIKVAAEQKRKFVVGEGVSKQPVLTDRWTVKEREDTTSEMYKKQGMTPEELDR